MDRKVSEYIAQTKWTQELTFLRSLLLDLDLEETVKWSAPAYTYKGKNVLGMAAFKNYFGIWFHQGVFLQDEAKVLMNAQEGKTKAMRQWRFSSIDEIDPALVKSYALEAMKNVELGKELKPKRASKPLIIPEKLAAAFSNDEELEHKFSSLSLTKKREFAEHIATAKREATQNARLEKIIPMIKEGIGLNDKYRNC
ncbi:YdeI/OmpD-associated family protein [Tenacibaculum amylolyticum]|uniref:YdeI/OmpD-associated family protein n=1 Tax=Tenacibaculum amylolyticum TaxID=104269 RepID=UPI003894DB79